ncbi:uncharacterized protein LOC141648938 [Silene latifolia]|uniref:uncharacterized protein LOC141648938 n=1 Tax=Silene latifolia TaxID=37657 RepID=UPI003D772C22
MSKGKSNAYFNGVPDSIKKEIICISWMVEGSLPFRYLGVLIKTTRLSAQDCKPIIDKVVDRIRVLGARKLSYAGRLVLVKAVLKTLHTYWASMFILPTRACRPRDEGGLGLKNELQWIKAAVGKLVWWIATKSDHLWVRWINHIYIKDKAWQTYTPPQNTSWYWRRVCRIRDLFIEAYQQNQWMTQQGKEYTIEKGYDFNRDKSPKVNWYNMVWNKWNIPKHSFISWVYHHRNMNTMEKLYRLEISEVDTCCLCKNSIETIDHLFFQCQYSQKVVNCVGNRIGISLPHHDLLTRRTRSHGSKIEKGIIDATINACIYHLWRHRNQSRIDLTLIHPKKVAHQLLEELQKRVAAMVTTSIREKDRKFVQHFMEI